MKTHSYQNIDDLHMMFDLLSAGGSSNSGAHYVHRGDLQWWLFYNDDVVQAWKSDIRLWHEDDRLIGWALLSPDEHAMDVFTVPELRGDSREHEMLAWASEQMPQLDIIEMNWIEEHDDARIRWLEANGFVRKEFHFVYFERSLLDPVPDPVLPGGFHIRTSRGTEEDARLRSVTSKASFGSTKPFDEYWPRTWRFMQSPIYVPEHEIFVMSPDEQVAAYCIVWIDPITKIGHFEPVGTHPDFQRKGFGKNLLYDAMIRLKSEGMTAADVCTNYDNTAAIHLYEAVGFKLSKRLFTYKKAKNNDNKTTNK